MLLDKIVSAKVEVQLSTTLDICQRFQSFALSLVKVSGEMPR